MLNKTEEKEQKTSPLPHLDELRVGIVVSDSKAEISKVLCDSAVAVLRNEGYPDNDITVVHVPNTFQLVFAASRLAKCRAFDAVIILGCIVRGTTPHFEYECQHVTQGAAILNAEGKVPVIFGVLTVDTEEQAYLRIAGENSECDKGAEAAEAAIRMAEIARKF